MSKPIPGNFPPFLRITGLNENDDKNKNDDSSESGVYATKMFWTRPADMLEISPKSNNYGLNDAEMKGAMIREQLYLAGTDVSFNDEDAAGDGDQSPILDADEQGVYEYLFQTDGDFEELWMQYKSNKSGFSRFASYCIKGRYRKVKKILEKYSMKHGKSISEIQSFLEKRETAMRLSPLLMVFAMMRRLNRSDRDDISILSKSTSISLNTKRSLIGRDLNTKRSFVGRDPASVRDQDLLKVVSVLLEYGARPDVKDVTGRTVCHYGADQDASDVSLAATSMCIRAAASAHCYGREVILRCMDDETLNGKHGIAAGFISDTSQRIVYLFGEKREVAVMNRNIRLVSHRNGKDIVCRPPTKPFNLVDSVDRLGRVCLHELLETHRVDVAKFLLERHEASVDIPDWNGYTLRCIALTRGSLLANGVTPYIAAEIMKRESVKRLKEENTCIACGKVASKEKPLKTCRPCMSVRYCSEECQKSHWTAGHRKECPRLRKLYKEHVVITRPSTSKGDVADKVVLTFNSGEVSMTSYRRPSHVAVDEVFTVKVQPVNRRNTILIYDKTRQCEFCLGPDQECYSKVLEKVKSEPALAGTRAYMSASFDKNGNCLLYVNRTKVKSW